MKVFAHRGFSGRYPQNTMLAFRKALESGCDGIELDVQLTKDGEVVIIHDEYLDDLTDFTGNVRDYTLGDLKSCNAGGKWQEVYGFQPIPTFEEYCEWASGNSLITNVEIKSSVYYYEELEKKTMELIERFGLKERIIISSFNHLSALSCKDFMPDIKTGALVGFECYHPGIEGLTKEEIELCHKNGIEVNVWTINNMDDLENLYEWGCDGVITNYPDVCKSWLEAKKAKD